jgi:hypothetical protein
VAVGKSEEEVSPTRQSYEFHGMNYELGLKTSRSSIRNNRPTTYNNVNKLWVTKELIVNYILNPRDGFRLNRTFQYL